MDMRLRVPKVTQTVIVNQNRNLKHSKISMRCMKIVTFSLWYNMILFFILSFT